MEKRIRRLETFTARGGGSSSYSVHGYEHERRLNVRRVARPMGAHRGRGVQAAGQAARGPRCRRHARRGRIGPAPEARRHGPLKTAPGGPAPPVRPATRPGCGPWPSRGRAPRRRARSASVPSSWPTSTPLTPQLIVMCPTVGTVIAAMASTRSSATPRAPSPAVSGSSTTNSSPPSRATTSDSRRRCFSAFAIIVSVRSPASWPCVSLTRLKWSASTTIRLTGALRRAAEASVAFSRSLNPRRLSRPVSGSWRSRPVEFEFACSSSEVRSATRCSSSLLASSSLRVIADSAPARSALRSCPPPAGSRRPACPGPRRARRGRCRAAARDAAGGSRQATAAASSANTIPIIRAWVADAMGFGECNPGGLAGHHRPAEVADAAARLDLRDGRQVLGAVLPGVAPPRAHPSAGSRGPPADPGRRRGGCRANGPGHRSSCPRGRR